jgi:hypothetical protein
VLIRRWRRWGSCPLWTSYNLPNQSICDPANPPKGTLAHKLKKEGVHGREKAVVCGGRRYLKFLAEKVLFGW